MLINDKEHYLPSIIDKYYHRCNLTSNLAETSFGILKRICSWTKQPLVTILETMMKRSILLYVNSMNKIVKIPFIFSESVDKLIGKVAMDHLINEFNQIINIKMVKYVIVIIM